MKVLSQRWVLMYTYMVHISYELIHYKKRISIDRVEWGRVNIWIVLHLSLKVVYD